MLICHLQNKNIMSDTDVLHKKFLTVQGLLDKQDFAVAMDTLDGMYKEYSAIKSVVEDNERSSAADNEQQMSHYVYKDFYAHHLITFYCQLFTALVYLLDGAKKYKDGILEAYVHVDNILSELETLEKKAPNEESRQRLWSDRRDYKEVRTMLSDCCGLPQCGISQEDYDDFLYSYEHHLDLLDDAGEGEIDEDDEYGDSLGTDDVYDAIDDYFDKKCWCNIHYYCLGVAKNNIVGDQIDYQSIIAQLQHDLGISLEEWQLKDDTVLHVAKRLEKFVTSKVDSLFGPSIDSNSLSALIKQNDKLTAPLQIEIAAKLSYRELGTTCIGFVSSGEVSVGDKVRLNYTLRKGEHKPELDNGVLSATVTWIETNGKKLTNKATAGQVLGFGLSKERCSLPETISSVERL